MPLFGTQLFLSGADVGTIYCRQHIRCAYRPPEAVLALIGSRILIVVYILYSGYAIEWNGNFDHDSQTYKIISYV